MTKARRKKYKDALDAVKRRDYGTAHIAEGLRETILRSLRKSLYSEQRRKS